MASTLIAVAVISLGVLHNLVLNHPLENHIAATGLTADRRLFVACYPVRGYAEESLPSRRLICFAPTLVLSFTKRFKIALSHGHALSPIRHAVVPILEAVLLQRNYLKERFVSNVAVGVLISCCEACRVGLVVDSHADWQVELTARVIVVQVEAVGHVNRLK
jgi:hypothetical protein